MNWDAKKRRLSVLSEIPSIARIDHRLILGEDGNLPFRTKLSKSKRRKIKSDIKKIVDRYSDILKKIKESGAGFPVDKFLRELVYEYTHRYASSGTNTQPLNFNYFESFCNIRLLNKTAAPYAVPTVEIDHLFNLTDYFDYCTSDKVDNFNLTSLMELPENKTLHFTTNGDVLDFSILNSGGREFVISGFSVIRRGNFLHWYLLGGEILTEEEWKLKSTDQFEINLDDINPSKKSFLSEAIEEDGNKYGSPIALEGTKTAIKTIITGEIDLTTQEYLARCLMTEFENSFTLISDDPEIFNVYHEEKRQNMIDTMKIQVNHVSAMWGLANSMFQLPSYFAYKVAVTKEVVVRAGKQVQKLQGKGGRGIHAQYTNVSSIDIIDSDVPVIRPVMPAHYNTNTKGHWRKLPNGATGKGPNGEVESGRTWVQKNSEWRETKEATKTIYIKSTVRAAELKVLEYEQMIELLSKTNELDVSKTDEKNGILYVLRCPSMKEEIYKVGWTSGTAQKRAKQLSNDTGVPELFVVVDSWEHKDAAALEKSVHAMLEPYRISDRREFFQANYQSIKKVIESEIQRSQDR